MRERATEARREIRRSPFAILLLAAMGLAGGGQRLAAQVGQPIDLSISEGLGFEAETGRPGALVLRELVSASSGRVTGSADLASALGVVDDTEGSLVDSAGLHLGYRFFQFGWGSLGLDSFVRYRFLFSYAWELRFGGTAVLAWGPGQGSRGLFGDCALGFEGIRTAIDALPDPLWEGDPLLRLSAGWQFAGPWMARFTLESFSDEDSTYFLRTLFDFMAGARLSDFTLTAHLMLKYSDFFTPTGYLDGLALRLAVAMPLGRGSRP